MSNIVSFRVTGRNIREARNKSRLTQEQVAEKLGMTQLRFDRLERGNRKASLEQIAQIAQVLDVSDSSLLRGSSGAEEFDLRPDAKEMGEILAGMVCGCSPVLREAMLGVCRALAENPIRE